MQKIATLTDLAEAVKGDEQLREQLRADPDDTLMRMARMAPAWQADRWIYRAVVIILGIVVLATLAMTIVHSFGDPEKSMPDLLISLGSAALGALAGLLAPNPR